MEIVRLDNIDSTNDYLLSLNTDKDMVVVSDYQTNGHGMDTNKWESEKGKNLLFSILVHPTWLHPCTQFLLSMAEALALYDVLAEYADDITIKWPNDIYWKDRKLSGTRIDGNLKGMKLCDLIIGTGININQEEFLSDAPNPVSLKQITGKEHDIDEILQKIIKCFEYYYEIAEDEWGDSCECDTIMELYHEHLYRRGEWHWYEDENGRFEGLLYDVHPNGLMQIVRRDNTVSQYEFKEVKFII